MSDISQSGSETGKGSCFGNQNHISNDNNDKKSRPTAQPCSTVCNVLVTIGPDRDTKRVIKDMISCVIYLF